MIIKAEVYQDKAYLLSADGRIWKITCEYREPPMIQEVDVLERHQVDVIMRPDLASFDRSIFP